MIQINSNTIEELRDSMIQIAQEKGSLTDPEVVAISQRLDTLIVDVQISLSLDDRSLWGRQYHLEVV